MGAIFIYHQYIMRVDLESDHPRHVLINSPNLSRLNELTNSVNGRFTHEADISGLIWEYSVLIRQSG